MSFASNANAQVVIEPENTYGNDNSLGAGIKIAFNTINLTKSQDPLDPGTLGTGHPTEPYFEAARFAGNLVVPIDLDSFPYVCRMIFGAPTTTGSADPYTHKFKRLTTVPSYVLDIGWTDIGEYHKYNGVQVDGVDIGIRNGQLVANLALVASSKTRGASAYDATPTDKTKLANRLFIEDATAQEGGSAVTTVEEFEFNFRNNVDQAYGLDGTGGPTDTTRGLYSITGNITGLFNGNTILTKGDNHTESSVDVTLTKSTHSISFYVDELYYGAVTPPINGPMGCRFTLPFRGFYQNATEASAFRITVINGTSSYA